VAAEAMPYHTQRRTDCNIDAARPRHGLSSEISLAIPSGREQTDPRSGAGVATGAPPTEVVPPAVHNPIRDARNEPTDDRPRQALSAALARASTRSRTAHPSPSKESV
jgi:hypothetical protein